MGFYQAQTIARKDSKLVWVTYLPRVKGKAKHLPNLICSLLDSAQGERVPIAKIADMTGRSRRSIQQTMRQLEATGLVQDGILDKAAWARWADTDHFDRLPSQLLGRLGADLSPGVLAACALLFSEALRDRQFVRADRERAELIGVGRATIAKAHRLLDQAKLVRLERKLVQLRGGRKSLHVVRPPSQPIRVAQGLGHRRATLQAWSADASNGRRGAAAGGSRFATTGQPIQSANQDNTADLLTIATLHSAQPGGSRAAKSGAHPHTSYASEPHTVSGGQGAHERVHDPITAKMGSSNEEQMGGLIGDLMRKVANRQTDDAARRERIARIDLSRRRDPSQQIEHCLSEAGLWMIEGKRPNPKLERRRWALARQLHDAGASPAQVLQCIQDAAKDSKVKAVSRVLDFRLRRLMDQARKGGRQPGIAPSHGVRQESPAIAAARRQALGRTVGAALASDWKALDRAMERAEQTNIPVTVEQIAAGSGLAVEVITAGLSGFRAIAAAG